MTFAFTIPGLMQNQAPGNLILSDAGDIANALSYDTVNSIDNAITASTTQTQAAGYRITAAFSHVTVANNNDAITLPQAIRGRSISIVNTSGNTIQVFPALNDAIGANGANNAVSPVNNRLLTLICVVTGTWWGGVTTLS